MTALLRVFYYCRLALCCKQVCGVTELSLAKPPTVGSRAITPQLLNSLKWDDPKILAATRLSGYPLQVCCTPALWSVMLRAYFVSQLTHLHVWWST